MFQSMARAYILENFLLRELHSTLAVFLLSPSHPGVQVTHVVHTFVAGGYTYRGAVPIASTLPMVQGDLKTSDCRDSVSPSLQAQHL